MLNCAETIALGFHRSWILYHNEILVMGIPRCSDSLNLSLSAWPKIKDLLKYSAHCMLKIISLLKSSALHSCFYQGLIKSLLLPVRKFNECCNVFVSYCLKLVSVPIFVNLVRSPGINSQPGGPVRNPICCTGPSGYIGRRHRFLLVWEFRNGRCCWKNKKNVIPLGQGVFCPSCGS